MLIHVGFDIFLSAVWLGRNLELRGDNGYCTVEICTPPRERKENMISQAVNVGVKLLASGVP